MYRLYACDRLCLHMHYKVLRANNSGSSKLISLCKKWFVILIMAGVSYTVATHHEFDGFLAQKSSACAFDVLVRLLSLLLRNALQSLAKQ